MSTYLPSLHNKVVATMKLWPYPPVQINIWLSNSNISMIKKTQILICKNISERQCHNLTKKQTCSSISESFLLVKKCFLSHVRALDGQCSPKLSPSDREQASNRNSVKAPSGSSLKRLRSSCVVIRMDDVDIHQASFHHQLI